MLSDEHSGDMICSTIERKFSTCSINVEPNNMMLNISIIFKLEVLRSNVEHIIHFRIDNFFTIVMMIENDCQLENICYFQPENIFCPSIFIVK